MELGEFAKDGNPQPQESQLLLSELLEQLGSSVTVLSPGPSSSPVVGNTEFAEVTDELPDIPGTFLFMMSSNALSRDDIERLVEQAVRRSYSAIALKCRPGRRAEISAIAANAGMAVIDVADHVTWRYMDAFVSSILGESNMSGGASRQASLEPLFALANSLAEVFGGSVSIEGMGRQILAYSSVPGQLIDNLRTRGILSRRVPLTAFNDVQYREVLTAKGPLRFPEFGEDYARMAIAVRAGSVPLGTIWAIDGRAGDDSLPGEAEKQAALAHAAWTAASHMLENWRIQDAN
ncbi:hypothetical protein [Arthrobacter sp. CJ23]|uniref:hypothetical protein n=1 Tax=Arthrobacter sp. CJ23 TaxID=2972479 RepID=UPI00215D3771|nr:hypothetical protein [Arthrobacter sp. CJ23]UVJ40135.1 hypothetical protein NVV90_02785 [Arthrobacter sp. CJ23]